MKTSNWFASGAAPGRIGISLAVPRRTPAGYRRFMPLAPRREMLRMPEAEYLPLYLDILSRLDPSATWDRLHELVAGAEPILLCFERDRCGCHRLLVAQWFERELGHVVDELG